MEFHENLRRLRKEAGLTQEDVARVLFLTRQSVSKWENGAAEPGVEHLKALADLYGVTVDDMLQRSAEQEKGEASASRWAYAGLIVFRLLICAVMLGGFHLDLPIKLAEGFVVFLVFLGIWVSTPYTWGFIMGAQSLHFVITVWSVFAGAVAGELIYFSVLSDAFGMMIMNGNRVRVRFQKERIYREETP